MSDEEFADGTVGKLLNTALQSASSDVRFCQRIGTDASPLLTYQFECDDYHTDKNPKDHICDICGTSMGIHADIDNDHNCDYCGEVLTPHTDADHNNLCDICGAALSTNSGSENNTQEMKPDDTVTTGNAWAKTVLRLQATASRKSIKLKWNAVPEADGYVIYWNRCGTKNGFKQLKVIESGKTLAWTHKALKSGTWNKYYVKAYKVIDGKKSFIKTSNRIHLTTKGGKCTNVKKLKSSVSSVTLKKGKAKTLKITQVYAEKNKKPTLHMRSLTYTTSNKTVATVTAKGRIKAKGSGSCHIYATAHSGVYKKIKVTVKE